MIIDIVVKSLSHITNQEFINCYIASVIHVRVVLVGFKRCWSL